MGIQEGQMRPAPLQPSSLRVYLELQLGCQKVGLWRGSVLGSAGLQREHGDESVPHSVLLEMLSALASVHHSWPVPTGPTPPRLLHMRG